MTTPSASRTNRKVPGFVALDIGEECGFFARIGTPGSCGFVANVPFGKIRKSSVTTDSHRTTERRLK
jgi:hypothetical protein